MVYDYRETIIDENLCSGLIEKPSGYMYMRFDNQDQMRMLAKDETRSLSLSLSVCLSPVPLLTSTDYEQFLSPR